MKNQVSVIVPTYNERDNLPELVKRLDEALTRYKYEIIVVDDDSPDKTWKIALDLSKNYPVKVIKRIEERGLSTAVLKGFKEINHDIVIIMDADLQHPPEKVPELVESIKDGADIAIGSRFVEGGSIGNWSYRRLFVSKIAGFLAKTFFREIREINDIESGFFAFRRSILSNVQLKPVGYKILLEMLVIARDNYEVVKEVPFAINIRHRGKSKLGLKNISNYLYHILILSWRTKEIHRFIKFCIIGGVGTILNIAILYSLTEFFRIYYLLSGFIGIETGLLSNFILNKLWTFKDIKLKTLKAITRALFRDHLIRSVGILLNIFILWFLTSIIGVYYLLSQILGIVMAVLWNFGGNKWFTWEQTLLKDP